jgi:hypothetical protein
VGVTVGVSVGVGVEADSVKIRVVPISPTTRKVEVALKATPYKEFEVPEVTGIQLAPPFQVLIICPLDPEAYISNVPGPAP